MINFSGFSSAELKTAEKVMLRALDVISEAKFEAMVAEARLLPCGGGCQVVTWGDGVWCCPAVHHGTDLACQLQERHVGQHVHCNSESDDPLQHNILRWADEKREVA